MKEIVIVAGKRTPMSQYGGALRERTALELGAIAAKAAIEQSKFEPQELWFGLGHDERILLHYAVVRKFLKSVYAYQDCIFTQPA